MNKWKNIQTGRVITVLGDEIINGKKYRFYSYDNTPDSLCEWNLSYGLVWEENFVPLTNSVTVLWFGDMTKAEAIAYLRKKQLFEKQADAAMFNSNPNAEEAMRELEGNDEKNLTTDPESV